MTASEIIKLKVDEKIQGYAKVYSSLLNDDFQRKRAYASLIALYALVDNLEQSPYTVQKSMTLFRNPDLNENYEISDFYINGWHIDVRIVTGGDAVLVPKVHFDSDIVPDFYAVVKVDSSLENAELLGFIDTKIAQIETFDEKYNFISFESLINYNEFLPKLVVEKKLEFTEEEHELFRTSYLKLLDNNLDTKTKNKVLKHLFECAVCRTEFCCFTGFEMVCCNTSKYPEILDDHTLGFIGAQNVDDVKYEGKEEIINISPETEKIDELEELFEKNETQVAPSPIKEPKDETVSDILDGLFHIDEGVLEDEKFEEKTIQPQPIVQINEEIPVSKDVVVEEHSQVENVLDEVETVFDEENENVSLNTEIEELPSSVSEDTNFDIEETIVEEIIDEKVVVENVDDAGVVVEEEQISEVDSEITEVDSIDEIIEDVVSVSNIEIELDDENVEKSIVPIDDSDLQLIDDDMFIDVPRNVSGIEEDIAEMTIIPEEKPENVTKSDDIEVIEQEMEPISIQDDIVEIIPEEFVDVESTYNELVILNESQEEEILDIVPSSETYEETETQEFPSEEDFIINDDSEGIENIEDEIIDEATMLSQEDNVQKVIVDYDEYGEPIYSYVTEVEKDENTETQDDKEEILSIDEENDEDDFEEYPTEEDETQENEDVELFQESDNEEYDSVNSDENVLDENFETVAQSAVASTVEDVLEDGDTQDAEASENIVNVELEEDEDSQDEVETVDEVNEDEEEYTDNLDDESEENEDDMLNYDDENQDEYEEDYDEEYEEDYDEVSQPKKSSGLLFTIISIIVLLGLAGGGIFYFLNKGKVSEEQVNTEPLNENVIETTESQVVNDMFEQPIDAPQENQLGAENNSEPNIESNEVQQGQDETISVNNNENSMFEEKLPELPKVEENPGITPLTEKDLLKPKQISSNGDVNKTIVNAFSTNASSVSLRALNWFCASSLFSDLNFKNYLQTIDNSLKQNLRNNFMGILESPPNDSVGAKFAVDNRGNLKKVIISETSGSEEIDNVVLQSIKETFEGEKSQILNDNELKQDMYYLKVVIKL